MMTVTPPKKDRPEKGRKTAKIETTLAEEACEGDTVLKVSSAVGFKVGHKIRVGSHNWDVAKVVGFGSIKIDTPLKRPHAIGTIVAVVPDGFPEAVKVTIMADDPEEADAEDEVVRLDATSASESGYEVRVGNHTKKYNIPPLPKSRREIKSYQLELIEAVMAASSRPDEKEKVFLERVETMSISDPILDRVHRQYQQLNRGLLVALQNCCK